jgi:sec-independent protein translocase protein TatA
MLSPQLLVVLVIALLLFGGNRIPETMRGLGKGLKEFKKGLNEEDEPATNANSSADKPAKV